MQSAGTSSQDTSLLSAVGAQDQEEKAGTSTATGGAAGEQDDSATMEMLEQFIQDPNMQQLLYQYLPEPMRNKETFEWMLKNPEYRAQLQSMIKAQVRTGGKPVGRVAHVPRQVWALLVACLSYESSVMSWSVIESKEAPCPCTPQSCWLFHVVVF